VSDFDRVFLRESTPVPSPDEDFDDNDVDQLSDDEPPAAGREGLPSSFRMRADAHYVDLLTSRAAPPPVRLIGVHDIVRLEPVDAGGLGPLVESIAAYGIVQPLLVRRRGGRYELITGAKRLAAAVAAGLTEVPCLIREVDDERARALAEAENLRLQSDGGQASDAGQASDEEAPSTVPALASQEIIDSLATIESCLNLFVDGERPLRERVALSLAKAEAHRARWLVEAYGLLGQKPAIARTPVNASSLMNRALLGLEAEGRLASVKLALAIDEPERALHVDERLMSIAVTGAAIAMLGLLQGQGAATLKIRVSNRRAQRQHAIQLSQKKAAPPDMRAPVPEGSPIPGWPGGRGASLGLAVARRVMELHGGQVEISAGPRGGCIVTLTLPAGD
jgi:ParB-like chromosome segregation protein Spo0J